MPETADDEVRPVLQAAKRAPDELTEVGNVARQRVLHGAFDPGIAGLLGVEVRGVGRQVGHREVARMARQKGGRAAGAMGVQPVPDDQEGPADLAPEVPQGPDHPRLETLPRTCRAYNRPAGVTAATLDTSRRLLSRRSTGVAPRGAQVVPGRARK